MTHNAQTAQTPKALLLAHGLTAAWCTDERDMPCWCPACGEETDADYVLTFRECPACGAPLMPAQPQEVG